MIIPKHVKFIAAVALQVVIIFGIILFKVSILTGGTEVILRIAPVDPRDFLRGDYVTFTYSDISSVERYYLDNYRDPYEIYISDGDKRGPGDTLRNGDTIYAVVRRLGESWSLTHLSTVKPDGNEVFLKGRVESGGDSDFRTEANIPRLPDAGKIQITYGIEQYFIPEGKGANENIFLEKNNPLAKIVVDENGNAALKELYINGKRWP